MPVTFSSAVSVSAPAIVDTDPSQATGAASAGLGLKPDDEESIGASRIGSGPGTHHRGETGDGVGV